MLIPTYMSVSGNTDQRLYMDAFTSLIPTFTSTPTRYPVSDKSVISLNVVKNNPTISLTGYTGQHPIKGFNNDLIGYSDLEQRPIKTHELLQNWYTNSTRIYIYNEFFQFDGYVITSYTPYQLEQTDTLRFDLTLEYIRNVSYERGTLIEFLTPSKATDSKSNTKQSDSNSKESEKKARLTTRYLEVMSNGFESLAGLEGE